MHMNECGKNVEDISRQLSLKRDLILIQKYEYEEVSNLYTSHRDYLVLNQGHELRYFTSKEALTRRAESRNVGSMLSLSYHVITVGVMKPKLDKESAPMRYFVRVQNKNGGDWLLYRYTDVPDPAWC